MDRFANFVKYNNGFPFIVMLLVLGSGTTFAASPEARDAVFSEESQVVSVDNHLILETNLDDYDNKIKVTKVAEDNDNYYVSYELYTIDLVGYSWQSVLKEEMFTVAKALLDGSDLGLYVTEQLAQLSEADLIRLKETQLFERTRGLTDARVATAYDGLIGKFLNPKTETIPGYRPVIKPPERPEPFKEYPMDPAFTNGSGNNDSGGDSGDEEELGDDTASTTPSDEEDVTEEPAPEEEEDVNPEPEPTPEEPEEEVTEEPAPEEEEETDSEPEPAT